MMCVIIALLLGGGLFGFFQAMQNRKTQSDVAAVKDRVGKPAPTATTLSEEIVAKRDFRAEAEAMTKKMQTMIPDTLVHRRAKKEFEELIRQWVETDLQGALQWAEQTPNQWHDAAQGLSQFCGGMLYTPMSTVIYCWASRDPAAALKWVQQQTPEGVAPQWFDDVLAGWVQHDFDSAFQWAQQKWGRDRFPFHTIASELAKKDTTAALQWAQQFPPEQKWRVISAITGILAEKDPAAATTLLWTQWHQENPKKAAEGFKIWSVTRLWGEIDPAAAVLWVQQLSSSNLTERMDRSAALYGVVLGWSTKDSLAAAQGILQLPDAMFTGEGGYGKKEAGLCNVLQIWSYNDPVAAAQWIQQTPLPENIDRDALLAASVPMMGIKNPRLAVQLATQFLHDQKHDWVLEHVLSVWMKTDSNAANDWLKQSTLPEATKVKILKGFEKK